MSIESGMLDDVLYAICHVCIQYAMYVSILLLLTTCVSRSVYSQVGNNFVISGGLLHVFEQTESGINCSCVWQSPFLHTHPF